jgi:hypothetical protein
MRLERFAHDKRDKAGKFVSSPKCDACGKPVGTNYYTDDEVCSGSDGPGFYLCERKRCGASLEGLDVVSRRSIYEKRRAKNDGR